MPAAGSLCEHNPSACQIKPVIMHMAAHYACGKLDISGDWPVIMPAAGSYTWLRVEMRANAGVMPAAGFILASACQNQAGYACGRPRLRLRSPAAKLPRGQAPLTIPLYR